MHPTDDPAAHIATATDPLNFLTLERTFCSLCFSQGHRPADMPDGVLGGVRFGRNVHMAGASLARYRRKARFRVLSHMVKHHRVTAERLYPEFTAAHSA